MTIKNAILFFFIAIITQGYGQKKQEILFTIAKEPVYTDEFLRVFNKNRDIVDDINKNTVDEYLELYINYKLKLKQAYQLKLDTVARYQKELKGYKEQLIAPYLKDFKITESLVQEAYDRMKTEVRARHILVRLNPKASPKDTLKAYSKLMEARSKVIGNAPFTEIAKQYSEDPSAQKNGGDLGYFSAFNMVYSFENAAYNNEIGTVSMPFKTNFGYHILKVEDKRPSKGEVEVAHIMLKVAKDSTLVRKQINDIYTKLQQGDNFDFLAKQYSDDNRSALQGGKLPKFPANRMIKAFSEVAFSLEKVDDISKPFKTEYGWHIVKLIQKHPLKSYDELKEHLTEKIEKSERVATIGKSIASRLKQEYKIDSDKTLAAFYFNNDTVQIAKNSSKAIFIINDKKINLGELNTYNNSQQKKSRKNAYDDFLNQEIIQYYKENLEFTDKEFASTMQEYKDGLLLFDLLQEKIWTRAERDTIALVKFFDKNRNKYQWKERANIVLATCTKSDKAQLVKKHLENNQSIDEIKKNVNDGATIHVLFSEGILEAGNTKLPKDYSFTKGVSNVYNEGNNQYIIIKVKEIIPPTLKELKEAKGIVINDFQKELEAKWISELRNTYKVKIKKKALSRINLENN